MDDRPPEHGASVDGLPVDTWREWNCFIKATAISYSSGDILSYMVLLFYNVYAYMLFSFQHFLIYFVTAPDDVGRADQLWKSSGALFVIAGASLLMIVGITA